MKTYQNADQNVIGFVCDSLNLNTTVWLCTVLSTWGSSPRPKGSLFAFNTRGLTAGSLSGGCVEEDLVDRTLQASDGKDDAQSCDACEVIVFGATPEEAGRLQLPCGGQLRVCVERLDCGLLRESNEKHGRLEQFQQIATRLDEQKSLIREVSLEPYRTRLLTAGEVSGEDRKKLNRESIFEADHHFLQLLGPRYTLMLVGISEVSRAVAMLAAILDYEIVVCDPRPEVVATWSVEGVTVIQDMPDDVIAAQASLEFTAVLALTHDPRIDDLGLMEALTRKAFYIGAMGSERSARKRRERLLELDITEVQMEVLHAPVGLDIGSKTPAEIALSILADITRERRVHARAAALA